MLKTCLLINSGFKLESYFYRQLFSFVSDGLRCNNQSQKKLFRRVPVFFKHASTFYSLTYILLFLWHLRKRKFKSIQSRISKYQNNLGNKTKYNFSLKNLLLLLSLDTLFLHGFENNPLRIPFPSLTHFIYETLLCFYATNLYSKYVHRIYHC